MFRSEAIIFWTSFFCPSIIKGCKKTKPHPLNWKCRYFSHIPLLKRAVNRDNLSPRFWSFLPKSKYPFTMKGDFKRKNKVERPYFFTPSIMKGQKSTFVGVKLLKNIENFCRQKESASFGDTLWWFVNVFIEVYDCLMLLLLHYLVNESDVNDAFLIEDEENRTGDE